MKNYNFWKKVSNYTTIMCGLGFIILMFFKKYVYTFMLPFLLICAIVLMVFIISEIMKYLTKNR